MDFRIGAPVMDRNGEKVGEVKHVIVDPDTREVAEIVLGESGLLGRDAIVPIGAVAEATHDGVRLDLEKDQLGQLKDFVITRFIAPPPESTLAGGWLYPQPIPPVGAATGLESIAYTPMVESIPQMPEGDVDIRPGTEVWASGEKVGKVGDVLYDDETKRVCGFVIKHGFLFPHTVEVSIGQVSAITSDRINLNVTKEELERGQP